MLGETLVVVAIVLPAICGVGAPGRRPDAGATIAGLAAAAALLVVVVVDEPVRMLGGWVVVDRVGGMWLLFVVFTTAVVRRFAAGSLGADDRWARFLRTTALAGAASAFLMVAGNLWALTVASVVSGLAATTVIRRGSPVAASAVATRAQRTFFVGDAALLVATIVLVSNVGSAEFASLGEASGAAREWGALLLVLAALVRCAQLPSHGWLVQSLSAPTPTSAFLHAGVVNGGGVILIRTARLGTGATLATIACVVITTVGLVVAAAVMRVRADVKGRLVWLTIGQMGFMLLQAALGLTAAAALHLVAHGMYKSNLFLNSGTGLEHRPHHRIARPTGPGGVIAGGAAVVVVGAAVLISGFSPRGNDGGNLLIVGFGVLTVYALVEARSTQEAFAASQG